MKYVVIILFYILFVSPLNAQDQERFFSIEIGSNYNYSLKRESEPVDLNLIRSSASAELAFFYESEYMIDIGLRSAYIPVKSVKEQFYESDGVGSVVNYNLTAIPIMLEFRISYESLQLSYSNGAYIMLTNLDAYGSISKSSDLMTGFSLGIKYNFILDKKFELSPVAQIFYISENSMKIITLGLKLNYNFYKF